MKLIGLSLSSCIRDIVSGKVDLADIDQIISSTMASTAEIMEFVLDRYQTYYWRGYPNASHIARDLYNEDRIYQPRLDGHSAHNISHGHWIEVGHGV